MAQAPARRILSNADMAPPPAMNVPLVDLIALRADIMAEVQSRLQEALAQVSITVDAPAVAIDNHLPPITIPESAIVMHVPGMEEMCNMLTEVAVRLTAVESLLRATVTKTVQRDANGLIATVTETR